MKKILITGSKGFIGKNIIKKISNDFTILTLDENDIFENENWKDYLNNWLVINKPDIILHVGACSDTLEQNVNYMMTRNFESTKVMVDYCKSNDCKIVYSSSAASYGTDGNYPSNLYGWSKYVAEQYVVSNGGIGLRYSNVYGPNEEHKGKMSSMIYQIIKKYQDNEKIKLFPKHPKRDFVYVKDVVNSNLFAINNYEQLKGSFYDVGTGNERSFEDILKCLDIENFEYFDEKDIPKGYQFHTKANVENFMKNWNPEYNLEDGIRDYLKYVK